MLALIVQRQYLWTQLHSGLPVGQIEMDNENITEPGHGVETHAVSTRGNFESDKLKTLEQKFQEAPENTS